MRFKCNFNNPDMFKIMKKHGLTTQEIADIVADCANDGLKIFMQYAPYDSQNRHSWHSSDYIEVSEVRIYPNQSYCTVRYSPKNWEMWKQAWFHNYDVSSEWYHWKQKAEKEASKIILAKMEEKIYDIIKSKN